jgi:hypothetical protein
VAVLISEWPIGRHYGGAAMKKMVWMLQVAVLYCFTWMVALVPERLSQRFGGGRPADAPGLGQPPSYCRREYQPCA